MGRHTAPDGDAVHPVVAEALARRPADIAGAHRNEGSVGWPGEPPAPGSGGLGWPGDLAPTAPVRPVRDVFEDHARAEEQPKVPTPRVESGRRRGWRRLFGHAPAA